MVVVIDCGSTKTPAIEGMVKEHVKEVARIDKDHISDATLKDATALIISGAPILLTREDERNYLEQFFFLKDIKIPVLGICFGHQILGMVHGAQVYLGRPVMDKAKVEVLRQDVLFEGLDRECVFVQDHTEGIELPHGFNQLAKSAEYPIETMKHREKPLYGVQFHPEVSGENGRILFRNFLKLIQQP
jgi:GMP synthase (glutamine-hydrolysing)